MYLEHFGLSEPPFRITPHTDFFFAGANRGATLEALIYAITREEGIVQVSGEVGSGKTMLCRMLIERLPPSVETVYLANPTLSPEEMLFALAEELRLSLPTERPSAVLRALQDRLIELHGAGRQVVVLIDEAHAMPGQTLEQIRLLSNLETRREKLLQIVLFGQPEFDATLAQPHMRQLKDRITHHFSLEPLAPQDVAAYLDFRLRAAGYRGPELFSPGAVKAIASASAGLTRRINVLADKSLLCAFAGNTHRITAQHVRAAVRDARMDLGPSRSGRKPLAWAALAATAVAIASGVGYWIATISSSAVTGAIRPVGQPPATSEAPASRAEAAAPPTPAAAPPTMPSITTTADSTARARPLEPATPAQAASGKVQASEQAAGADVAPRRAAPVGETRAAASAPMLSVPAEAGPPSEPARAIAPADGSSSGPLGERTRELVARTQQWLPSASDDHWFIQLLTADASGSQEIERFVSQAAPVLREGELRAYHVRTTAGRRIGVIYGEFASRAEAEAALASLPPWLRTQGAYLRQVRRLRL